jgi:hypothetical protein
VVELILHLHVVRAEGLAYCLKRRASSVELMERTLLVLEVGSWAELEWHPRRSYPELVIE